jgi:3-oxoacyl-[acyl-carrier protein] reductase
MSEAIGPLGGQSALVIGGGEGIGRAITRAFGAAGAAVAVADLDPERAREAADEIASDRAGAARS